jgi:hypothetical protein
MEGHRSGFLRPASGIERAWPGSAGGPEIGVRWIRPTWSPFDFPGRRLLSSLTGRAAGVLGHLLRWLRRRSYLVYSFLTPTVVAGAAKTCSTALPVLPPETRRGHSDFVRQLARFRRTGDQTQAAAEARRLTLPGQGRPGTGRPAAIVRGPRTYLRLLEGPGWCWLQRPWRDPRRACGPWMQPGCTGDHQSATGQAVLLTGRNVPAELREHYGRPNPAVGMC